MAHFLIRLQLNISHLAKARRQGEKLYGHVYTAIKPINGFLSTHKLLKYKRCPPYPPLKKQGGRIFLYISS